MHWYQRFQGQAQRRTARLSVLVCSVLLLSGGTAYAEVIHLMRYQGNLTTIDGDPLDGSQAITFRLYKTADGGTPVWEETHTDVAVAAGQFSVLLGELTPLDLTFVGNHWLTTEVNSDGEMAPRQRLSSVPYAYHAEGADKLLRSDFTITDSSFMGIGTVEPVTNIHAASPTPANVSRILSANGDTTSYLMLWSGAGTNQPALIWSPNTHVRFGTSTTAGGSWKERMRIKSNGNIGMGHYNPRYPLHMKSGAHVTAGGVWRNASSRELKQDITPLASSAAHATLLALQPRTFRYKIDPTETHIGFIAEDVPELVASENRDSISPMDIIGVLTAVVQEQETRIQALEEQLQALTP